MHSLSSCVPRQVLSIQVASMGSCLTVTQQWLHVRTSVAQVWPNCKRVPVLFLALQGALAAKWILPEGFQNCVLALQCMFNASGGTVNNNTSC